MGRGPRVWLLNTPSPQDGCNASDSQPTFKILTENVVCAKSGATCSRAIKILLGVSKRVASPTAPEPQSLATQDPCRPLPLTSTSTPCQQCPPELDNSAVGRGLPQA